MKRFFITGTDTDCGKTYVTCQLLNTLRHQQKSAVALKPIASGCIKKEGEWHNEDVWKLQQQNTEINYPINKWLFPSPVSPHLAAEEVGVRLSVNAISEFCSQPQYQSLDYLLIEGAGGVMVPLNDQETWLDFLSLTQIPSILVVGMRLGCLNHALLTEQAFKANELPLVGWVANCLDNNMRALPENIETLRSKLQSPLLATVSYQGEWSPKRLL